MAIGTRKGVPKAEAEREGFTFPLDFPRVWGSAEQKSRGEKSGVIGVFPVSVIRITGPGNVELPAVVIFPVSDGSNLGYRVAEWVRFAQSGIMVPRCSWTYPCVSSTLVPLMGCIFLVL